jgi:excisionase family DNA binding protein
METINKTPTLENLPRLIVDMAEEMNAMHEFIRVNLLPLPPPIPKFLDVDGLKEHLLKKTGKKPATQTIYGWVSSRKIPYTKFGKELRFEVTQIEEWLNNGRQMNHLKEAK